MKLTVLTAESNYSTRRVDEMSAIATVCTATLSLTVTGRTPLGLKVIIVNLDSSADFFYS